MYLPNLRRAHFAFAAIFLVFVWCADLRAQDNYEIQVYPSETMAPGVLLTELHSNYNVEGSTSTQYGMLPTQGQEHETVEFTQGIPKWSEVGFYVFTEEHNGTGVQWVGDHIRPPSAFRFRGIGPWELACRMRLATPVQLMPIPRGPGRSCPLSTRLWESGIGQSTPR